MIKIQPMRAKELQQVLHLLERFSEDDFEYRVLEHLRQLYGPIQRVSQMLPPRWQFVPAIYVAVSNGKVLGLIWLEKDGKNETRWKIEQLIIDPEEFSFDVGAQLLNYVINLYGAEGIQTFIATVHNQYEQALGLMKSCGFRHVTRLHAYCHEAPQELKENHNHQDILRAVRESSGSDRHALKALHDDSMPADKRLSLGKSHRDFGGNWLDDLSANLVHRLFSRRWVVEDRTRDTLLGTLLITSEKDQDFFLSICVGPVWEEGFQKLLDFGVERVLAHSSKARIFVNIYAFHEAQRQWVESVGFSRLYEAEVLVKDYWIPLKNENRLTSPVMFFTGNTSTA